MYALSRTARRASRCTLTQLLVLALVANGFLLAGCGGSAGRQGPLATGGFQPDQWPTETDDLSPLRQGCDVLADPARPGGAFVFALTDEVLPAHAPVPHNQAERVVFAQLYETLVNVTCDGNLTAGLAANWACTEDSTTWVFTLREDARFWDGTRVTAERVRQAWSANQTDVGEPGVSSPWHWVNARATSITAVDARRLAIQLPEPQARFPLLLAHPATAVAIRQPGWVWPVGSGPCRLRASDPAPRPGLECRPNPAHPDPPIWKSLVFNTFPGADPRDLLSAEFDLAMVRQSEATRFFDEAPGYAAFPLPWDRLYLLVCPPDMNTGQVSDWAAVVANLQPARDLNSVSARAWPHVVFPLSAAGSCPQLSGPIAGRRAAPRDSELADKHLTGGTIAFSRSDPAAAELAARLSHLAGAGTTIADLEPMDLELALQWQMAGAFIVVQDEIYPTGCLQLAALLGRAAWLQEIGLAEPAPGATESLAAADALARRGTCHPALALARAGVVHPLALSRPWLVARGELAGLRLAFDGTPLLNGLGAAVSPKAVP